MNYEEICSFETLYRAYLEARKCKRQKRVLWACVLNGFAWVWCSYVLAALDKPQIAESLSQVALAEIIVPVAVYAGKSAIENLSKNNHGRFRFDGYCFKGENQNRVEKTYSQQRFEKRLAEAREEAERDGV